MELETNSRRLLKLLKEAGFEEVSSKGSHLKLRKGDRTVILPHPKKDLPLGTVRSIYQQAGLLQPPARRETTCAITSPSFIRTGTAPSA